MNRKAMRWPSRVVVTARANRKAAKTSQTVRFANPDSTRAGGRVREMARKVMARSALTPMGTGCAIKARMVATKTASRWRWGPLKPRSGRNQSARPGISTAAQRVRLRGGLASVDPEAAGRGRGVPRHADDGVRFEHGVGDLAADQ